MSRNKVCLAGVSLMVLVLCGSTSISLGEPDDPDLDNWKGSKNNCYNYATDQKNNNFAQPGGLPWNDQWGGAQGTVAQWCEKVKARAIDDGLNWVNWAAGDPIPTPDGGKNLVALGALAGTKDGGGDYHWWRFNGDDTWSHKRGKTPAKTTYTDANGIEQAVTDPRQAGQRDGYGMCGFMGVPKDPLPNIKGEADSPQKSGALITLLRRSGRPDSTVDLFEDQIPELAEFLPTFEPSNQVPDPEWSGVSAGESLGFGLEADSAGPDFPPYMRIFRGVAAVYSDLDGTQITYYNDNNGLEAYLGSMFLEPIPTVSEWGLLAMAVVALGAGAFVFTRGRRCTTAV